MWWAFLRCCSWSQLDEVNWWYAPSTRLLYLPLWDRPRLCLAVSQLFPLLGSHMGNHRIYLQIDFCQTILFFSPLFLPSPLIFLQQSGHWWAQAPLFAPLSRVQWSMLSGGHLRTWNETWPELHRLWVLAPTQTWDLGKVTRFSLLKSCWRSLLALILWTFHFLSWNARLTLFYAFDCAQCCQDFRDFICTSHVLVFVPW